MWFSLHTGDVAFVEANVKLFFIKNKDSSFFKQIRRVFISAENEKNQKLEGFLLLLKMKHKIRDKGTKLMYPKKFKKSLLGILFYHN